MKRALILAAAFAVCFFCLFRFAPIAFANDVGICADTPCGDVSNDGVTTATDALAALRIAVGLPVTEDFCSFTVCEGGHCISDVLPISSMNSEPTGDVACFVGPAN